MKTKIGNLFCVFFDGGGISEKYYLDTESRIHGECQYWNIFGTLCKHEFYNHGIVIHDFMKDPKTEETELFIKLKSDGPWFEN